MSILNPNNDSHIYFYVNFLLAFVFKKKYYRPMFNDRVGTGLKK